MTTGYDGIPDGAPRPATGGEAPAPLPPRIQPSYQQAAAPPVAPATWPAPTWPAPPVNPYPHVAASSAPVTGEASAATAPVPASAIPLTAPPAGGPLPPVGPAIGFAQPRRGAARAALILAVVLFVVAVAQTVMLVRLDHRLAVADRRNAAQQQEVGKQLDTLGKRTTALEKRVGGAFDPAAVAADVQPSVFRVEAGDFTGTAFAVAAASGGGTRLITNFHVVDQVYTAGKRDVALVRKNLRFPATIVKVDKANDLAVLSSKENFPKLTVASETVQPGEPIVVIGAPLGLEGSVTTGVVSALRTDIPGENGRTVIQFDAAINPGNSGGPVVNGKREVVGVASAKARDAEGIGLAIPIAVACRSFSGLC
ncbi:MAG TPA: trypsin-like peptidase domain-containing protein [Micromonosporaceae bacterium]